MAEAALYLVVYVSRARARLGENAVAGLGREANDRNMATGVTGLLMYDGERFMQALEGPRAGVLAAMDRIAGDTRHHSIACLRNGPSQRRQFGDHGMKYKPGPQLRGTADFLARVKIATADVQDDELRAAFIGFAFLNARRPRTALWSGLPKLKGARPPRHPSPAFNFGYDAPPAVIDAGHPQAVEGGAW